MSYYANRNEHILVHKAIKTYCQRHPEADLSCVQFSYKALAEQLSVHLIDIMVSTGQYLYTMPDLEHFIIEIMHQEGHMTKKS